MACPNCGSEGPFGIAATKMFLVTDEGTEDVGGDTEWENNSACECKDCGHSGTVLEFEQNLHVKEYAAAVKAFHGCSAKNWKSLNEETRNEMAAQMTDTQNSFIAEAKARETQENMPKIVITLDGGLIQQVHSNVPLNYLVYDLDIEGCSEDDIAERPSIDRDGTVEVYDASVHVAEICAERINLAFAAVNLPRR
jgi:hypothetical protein